MDKFDIVKTLEDAATVQGWNFIFSIDSYTRNIQTTKGHELGVNTLIVDVKYGIEYAGSNVGTVTYQCLMMLGRKYDADGWGSSHEEYDSEKYNRRLKDLVASLADFIGVFACSNELEVDAGQFQFSKNMFNDNLDFVVGNNVIFKQS